MKLHTFNRKFHYWAAIVVALPVLVIVCSGLLLQMKKQVAWVQPPEQRGASQELGLSFPQILAACRSVKEARIETWDDVNRLDVRPSRGMIKVWAKNNWEIQLDVTRPALNAARYFETHVIFAVDVLNPTPSSEGLPRSIATNSPILRTSVLTFHLR
jgi:hypothetical protein